MSGTGYFQIEAHSYGILKREASPFLPMSLCCMTVFSWFIVLTLFTFPPDEKSCAN